MENNDPPPPTPTDSPPTESTLERLHRALGPLAGAIILDITDFVTFGPIGLVLGVAIGFPVGYWIASLYGFSRAGRWLIATLSGIYCTIPFTELIPLATMVAAVARYRSPPSRRSDSV